ncbi:DoxX family membrane protein [Maritimibacter sp. DP1N21-5]|uniref:DoxX family membrane protein n=1 Tax=Maritimibacter sp. DP1N21-5 TaxID=2836867 RepID=UPI001C47DC65|nr:DoxX family membrane protein [Maritimibacter sp. DP1N21-5]MBV7410288.1 DoxX family membrane protein [Maritimibacter sp. DP1N21-5]
MRNTVTTLYGALDNSAPTILPSLARFAFAAVLAPYYWASAVTKVDGAGLSVNGYAQIFPRAMEAVNYDPSQLGLLHSVIVAGGTLAELLLPALLILGLLTRPAALGMIGFIVVQSLTDLFGHGALGDGVTLGALFDRAPDSVILDQRLLWLTLLATCVFLGPGPLSLDRLARRRSGQSQTA